MVRSIRDTCSCVTDLSKVETSGSWPDAMGAQPRHSLPVGQSVRAPQKRSLERWDSDVRVSTRRTKHQFTAALVPSVEAWAFTFAPGTRETLVMLEAVLLAASTSTSAGERQVRGWSKLLPATPRTDRHLDTDVDVRVASQPCFLGREASANAFASRAQETSRECNANAETRREAQEDALLNVIYAKRPEQFQARKHIKRADSDSQISLFFSCRARVRNSRALIRRTPSACALSTFCTCAQMLKNSTTQISAARTASSFFFQKKMRHETNPIEAVFPRHVSTESLYFLRSVGCAAFRWK